MFRLLFFALVLSGCQTAQQKSVSLVSDRIQKLKPLSTWKPTWCQVDATLTQPAVARYQQMFPEENLGEGNWGYTWKSRESTCEITPLVSSPATKSHQAFLETAMCLLMQVHFVNSPFDELAILPTDIEAQGSLTRIRAGESKDLGIFLPPDSFTVETRTRSRGTLSARYEDKLGPWLPDRLEQRRPGTAFVVDDIEYQPIEPGVRPQVKSFWISVGAEQAVRHSRVEVSSCRNL